MSPLRNFDSVPLRAWKQMFPHAPYTKSQRIHVAGIESKLRSGDIVGIISRDRSGLYSTPMLASHCAQVTAFAFHARFFAQQLRPRGRGLPTFEISFIDTAPTAESWWRGLCVSRILFVQSRE